MNYMALFSNQFKLFKCVVQFRFLVRDRLYRSPCVSVCVRNCVSVYLFSVFRIVNETSTKASLAPAIDQLLYTNN